MCEYYLKPYKEATSIKLKYYLLFKGDRSFYEEFVDSLTQKKDKDELFKIIALMDMMGDMLLPKTKFRHIEPNKKGDRKDVYEFKSKHIRVYVIKKSPDVFIVLGGFKNNQEADIKKVFRHFNQIPEIIPVKLK